MTEESWVYSSGAWNSIKEVWVRGSSSWQEVQSGWLYDGSTWQQIFNFDTTGPSAPTSASATWLGAGGTPECRVTWTQPSTADFSYSKLERSVYSGGVWSSWSFISNYSGGAGSSRTYNDYSVSLFAYTVHSAVNQASNPHRYRITPYDTRGNEGTPTIVESKGYGDSVTRGFLQSPYYRNAVSSASWLDAPGEYVWTSGVSQGYQQTWNRRRFGFYFYNSATNWNLNVTSADIHLYRLSGQGVNNFIPAYLHTSSATSLDAFFGVNPLSPNLIQNAADPQGSFKYDTNATAPLNAAWADAIMSGASTSIVLDEEKNFADSGFGYSTGYSHWGDHNFDVFLGIVFSGTIRIYHTG